MFESVLKPGKIGNVEIKNRFVMPAMGSGHSEIDGTIGEEALGYYEARAKGGFGLIITEYCAIDPKGLGALNELRIYDDRYIPGFKKLADIAHENGAKLFAQLHQGGRWSDPAISDYPCVSASPLVWCIRNTLVHELTTEEVYDMVEMFGDAAVRAKKAGCDGVELHGGHGYLIPQFMSELFNKRTDEFGGDIYARSRFPRLIIENIKKKCGADFPVCMRISGDEPVEGGMHLNEMIAMLKIIEKSGLDAVNVSCGLPMARGDTSRSIGGFRAPLGLNVDLAEAVKKSVNMAVIAVGRLHDAALCDAVIAD
ncbi:MAG: NADH:flavin oxidoreductase, partial [Oscillospiraceae bacterium]|nr:NADH:flavin oxidoreductase [Oscillospiraceae bacterium]